MSLRPDVTELLNDPDIGGGQSFDIIRRTLVREKGRLGAEQTVTIKATGSIQPAGVDVLQQLPEGDRSGEVIVVRTTTAIQIGNTGATSDLLADEIRHNGSRYKVLQLKGWGKWGMYCAYATRIGGDAGV